MSYKTKVTNKKFYNKWLYKVTFNLEGAAIFRLYDLASVPDRLEEDIHVRLGYLAKAKNNKNNIEKMSLFLLGLETKSWAKRIERNFLDIYTNDRETVDKLLEEFEDIVRHVFLPREGTENDLTSSEIILTKKYPHDVYEYKAFLLPHRIKDKDEKKKYLEWIDNNPNILISQKVKEWFMATDWNWDRRYVFVKDNATLMLFKMRSGDVLGKVYNYKLLDK